MLCRFGLGVGLFFAYAAPVLQAEQPKPISVLSVRPVTAVASSADPVYSLSDHSAASGDMCPQCGHSGDCGHEAGCANGCLNTCNMPQHHAYFPAANGYYYFRPYQHRHVPEQQQAVARYGGDPRNPYDNSVFNKVYAELGIPEEVAPDTTESDTISPPQMPLPQPPVERPTPVTPPPVKPAPVEPAPAPAVPSDAAEPVDRAPPMPPVPAARTSAPTEPKPTPAEESPAAVQPQARFLGERAPASMVKVSSDPLDESGGDAAPAPPQGIVSEVVPALEIPEPPPADEATPAEPQPLTQSETPSAPIVSAALPLSDRGTSKPLDADPAVLNLPVPPRSVVAPSTPSQPVVTMASVFQFSANGRPVAPDSPAPQKPGDSRSRAASVRLK